MLYVDPLLSLQLMKNVPFALRIRRPHKIQRISCKKKKKKQKSFCAVMLRIGFVENCFFCLQFCCVTKRKDRGPSSLAGQFLKILPLISVNAYLIAPSLCPIDRDTSGSNGMCPFESWYDLIEIFSVLRVSESYQLATCKMAVVIVT